MAGMIDGRAMASAMSERTGEAVRALSAEGISPALAVVLVGTNPANEVYVARKIAECRKVGITSVERRFAEDCAESELLALIDTLNADAAIHGILIQLPLPRTIDATKVLDRIAPGKDVDGFHPVNVGRLSSGTGGWCRVRRWES